LLFNRNTDAVSAGLMLLMGSMKLHLIQFCAAVLFLDFAADGAEPAEFNVWAVSCAHVPADIRRGRESLAKVIRHSEGAIAGAPAFAWDIMIDAGDLSAHQFPPGDRDGMELIRQYQVMTEHRREQIYNVPGNHDAPYYDHVPGSWIRKWGDPLGENTAFSGVDSTRRPFAVQGNWERYRFLAGNILFLMLADRNDAPEPVGRGHSKDAQRGGFPAGAVTRDTFNWWKQQVLENQDKIIVTMHHHVLRDTTIASGNGEGNPRYHGASGGAAGSSYLYYLIENDDPDDFQYVADAHVFEDFLDAYQKEHGQGAIDLWIGGHTHVKGPEDDWGDKTISERKWGVGFLQVAALTRHHGGSFPLSRVLSFADGSDRLRAKVYLHEPYEKNTIGFYAASEIDWPLRHRFAAPSPIQKMSAFPEETAIIETPYVERDEGRKPRRASKSESGTHKVEPVEQPKNLFGEWKPETGGDLRLETQVGELHVHSAQLPKLVASNPFGSGQSLHFDGSQQLRVGAIDLSKWTDLTICAWIQTTNHAGNLRVISKDVLGTPGNFVLLQSRPGAWLMRAYDASAERWQTADWQSPELADSAWHHLAGVVDSTDGKVLLYVDGVLRANASWRAATLDDSDQTDLVVGSDSGKRHFGHCFVGLIQGVQIHSRVLSAEEIRKISNR
jgi:hypothetical protein